MTRNVLWCLVSRFSFQFIISEKTSPVCAQIKHYAEDIPGPVQFSSAGARSWELAQLQNNTQSTAPPLLSSQRLSSPSCLLSDCSPQLTYNTTITLKHYHSNSLHTFRWEYSESEMVDKILNQQNLRSNQSWNPERNWEMEIKPGKSFQSAVSKQEKWHGLGE